MVRASLCWVLLVLAGIAGGGAYFWLKMQQRKREAEGKQTRPRRRLP